MRYVDVGIFKQTIVHYNQSNEDSGDDRATEHTQSKNTITTYSIALSIVKLKRLYLCMKVCARFKD